ncbi:hypothetical protein J1N35_037441 [Gossypium stocksii]|uniref:Auxin-responsive protein n=1 Tax=Gossypium stocksii TaxID=47602 RepID=A0A9D3UK48_9ROSI|nr:hypothetical protein J1N35_037441 [Gossypium stocksii]
MEGCVATKLRLGLPGTDNVRNKKRPLQEADEECGANGKSDAQDETVPLAKAQIVGWPSIRSYRKNNIQAKKNDCECPGIYIKVSMDGAPYLRKIDLKVYSGYPDLLQALESMFKFTIVKYSEREGYKGSDYAPTYEDKDGDWMLVGDDPWVMFITSCKRLRIMKGSIARGLVCSVGS